MNNPIKKYRYDYLLIWGHGLKYQDQILNILRSYEKIHILKVHNHKAKNIKNLVKAVYSYDYAPFHHLKSKTKYLLNTPKEVIFIIVKTEYIKEIMVGKGAFEHIECPYIVKIKNIIRDKFNPKENGKRTEDHVIHASDNESQTDYILKYLGFNKGINLFKNNSTNIVNLPYHISNISSFIIERISLQNIYANILIKNNGKISKELRLVENTPHYLFLNGNTDKYKNYLKEFFGNKLSDDYSLKKFRSLKNNFKYLQKPYENSYILTKKTNGKHIIQDGVHRAAILKNRNFNEIIVARAK